MCWGFNVIKHILTPAQTAPQHLSHEAKQQKVMNVKYPPSATGVGDIPPKPQKNTNLLCAHELNWLFQVDGFRWLDGDRKFEAEVEKANFRSGLRGWWKIEWNRCSANECFT
ncbi:uncharacterized protein LOC134217004 [Armigeres subalbatus]|uniref:uncharacterized protein LOC134217004 n=1 Tax=Armigeres subalbatus TaxID=124917 RepID=UPI002ED166CD